MDKWLESWDSLYEHTEKTWTLLSDEEQQKQLEQLEQAAGSLLNAWTDMDEKLALLKIRNSRNEPKIVYQTKGTTYYELEMFQQAALVLEQESATGVKEELRLLYLAYSYLFIGELNRSLELFLYIIQASLTVMIQHFAYVGLGCYYVQEEKFDQAINAFEHANKLTTSADVVYNLGICHYLNKSYHVAKRYLKEAIDILPEDGEAYFFLGCCQWKNGEEREAFATWMDCLQLLNTSFALQALAYVCEWHGHHLAAVHCYKRMQALGERDPQVVHGLAWNLALLDKRTEALRLFEEMLQADPDNPEVNQSLSWLESVWNDSPVH